MTESRRERSPSRRTIQRLHASLVGTSSLLVVLCLASELQLFSWKLEVTPGLLQLHEDGVYSLDLRRAPFGIPGVRYMLGDREGLRPYHLHTRDGVTLYEDGRELGPPHVSLDHLSLGAGRFLYRGRVLHFTSSDASDPRSGRHRYAVRIPIVADWPLTISCIATWLLCIASGRNDEASWARRLIRRVQSRVRGRTARTFLSWRGDELVVFVLSIAAALAYTLSNSPLSIPHGPLVAGVGIQDARMWDDAALVFASGSGYNLPHRPGYPLLLGAAYALFGVSKLLPLILNLVAFGGTSLLVYKSAFALFDRATALAAVALLQTDVVRLDYLQVSNTDTVGCFLTASFVYTAFALLSGKGRSLLLWIVLGLLLGLANLVKTMTLPAIAVVVIYVAISGRFPGMLRKLLVIALIVGGLLAPLLPWNAFSHRTQGASELAEKGPKSLFLATSPRFNIDGNVDRQKSRRLRKRGFEGDESIGTIIDNLRNHWTAYVRNVLLATHKSFDTLHFGGHGSFLALSLGFLLALAARWNACPARRGVWILGSVGAFGALTWSLFTMGIWMPVAILGVVCVSRRDLRLFLALAAVPLLVTSMLGMGGYERQLLAVTWIYPIVTVGSLSAVMDGLGAALGRADSTAAIRMGGRSLPARAEPEIDWASLGIVAGFIVMTALGCLRIAADGSHDDILGTKFTMFGEQWRALPASEYERRYSGRGGATEANCAPEREVVLLQEALRLIGQVPRRRAPRLRIVCFRAYTGRHLYRIREGQVGTWHRHRPFFFDRLYARTIIRDASFIRISGLLEDAWYDRIVYVVGVMGKNEVFNAVILEEAEPETSDTSHRDRVRATDRRHLRATRDGT